MSALIKESPTLNAQFGKAPTPEDLLSLIRSFGGTFTRATETIGDPTPETLSASTYVDNLGLIRQPKVGYPRPNFVAGVNKGILIEEQRTNLALHSEAFDNAYWGKVNLNTTGTPPYINVAVAPDGAPTAEKMIENTTNANHAITGFAIIPIGTHTLSVFAKKGERTRIAVGSASGATATAVFDLEGGTVVRASEGIATGGKIEAYPNGWYRCSVTLTSDSALSSGFFIVNSGTNKTYLGDGTSGVFLWGAQLEAGSFATSYIPTAGATVTRGGEFIRRLESSDIITGTKGTIIIKSDFIKSNTSKVYFALSDGNSLIESMFFSIESSSIATFFVRSDSNIVSVGVPSANWDNGIQTFVITYGEGSVKIFNKGSLKATGSYVTFPTPDRLTIGTRPDTLVGLQPNADTSYAAYYPVTLTDAQSLLLSRL